MMRTHKIEEQREKKEAKIQEEKKYDIGLLKTEQKAKLHPTVLQAQLVCQT